MNHKPRVLHLKTWPTLCLTILALLTLTITAWFTYALAIATYNIGRSPAMQATLEDSGVFWWAGMGLFTWKAFKRLGVHDPPTHTTDKPA